MSMPHSRKLRSVEARNRRNGLLFTIPWLIGFLLFFLKPIAQSFLFAFSKVTVTTDGFATDFTLLDNFRYIFYESPEYLNKLLESIRSFASRLPVVLVLSLFIGVILNSKFKGKTFFRALYFIPVIVATGVVIDYISGDSVMQSLRGVGEDDMIASTYAGKYIDFNALFLGLGLPEQITQMILGYANDIFNLIWQTGVQIVLFIAGLQSIPQQLYEVSKVEGATKWEEFWKITIPMLGHTIVLVLIFTAIEFCVSTDNPVMEQAYTVLLDTQIYGQASAMLWAYFAISMAIVGAVVFLFYRFCLKRWE